MKLLRFSFFATLLLSAASAFVVGQPSSHALPDRFVPEEKGVTRLEKDVNGDGKVDDILWFDASGNRVKESVDANFDGRMDTFYYYNPRGVLARVEVDTTFDDKIDLWVWLTEGVYVTRYERDTDGDGKPDIVRIFGAETEAGKPTAEPQVHDGDTAGSAGNGQAADRVELPSPPAGGK